MCDHFEGIKLEHLVQDVFGMEKKGLPAFFSADHLSRKPFDAAVVILARIYPKTEAKDIDEFMSMWNSVFEYPDENLGRDEYTIENYIESLKRLVEKYKV